MRITCLIAITLAISLSALQGCQVPAVPGTQQQPSASQLATLQRQKKDIQYEIVLRQNEIDQMIAAVKGAIGVSNQWLLRKDELTEKITQLRVRQHDVDLQIEDLSKLDSPNSRAN